MITDFHHQIPRKQEAAAKINILGKKRKWQTFLDSITFTDLAQITSTSADFLKISIHRPERQRLSALAELFNALTGGIPKSLLHCLHAAAHSNEDK